MRLSEYSWNILIEINQQSLAHPSLLLFSFAMNKNKRQRDDKKDEKDKKSGSTNPNPKRKRGIRRRPQQKTVGVLLQTDSSSLSQVPLHKELRALADQCIKDACPLMVKRPPLGKKLFGRECFQPRNVVYLSDGTEDGTEDGSESYTYSGTTMYRKPLPESFKYLLKHVNGIFDAEYNGILVNQYVNGLDSIGRHRDDEDGLDECAGVVALTIGAERKFRIRDKNKILVLDVPTLSYHFLQMSGKFQEEFTHEIPKQPRVTGERWSITFRRHTK